ncbi:MAG TPA: hypothetical protein VN944_09395 [Nitrospiria bacterium]|nr:hypothetical protein [Nitrospiria bacterium]
MKNQQGKFSVGTLIWVLLFALAIDTCFRVIPVYVHYLTFKNDIKGRAIDMNHPNIDLMRTGILKKAEELELPVHEPELLVEMTDGNTHVKADWSIEVKLAGGYYPYKLTFSIDSTRPNIQG